MSRCRSPVPSTAAPSTARIVSVGRRPARSAGLPDGTSMTPTPLFCPSSSAPPRRQRPAAADDAEIGAPHPPVAHQRRHDVERRRVDRARRGRGRSRPAPCSRPTRRARESTSAPPELPGVQRGVGLDHVLDDPSARGQRAAERADHAGGHRAGEAVRVARPPRPAGPPAARRRCRARPGPGPRRRRAARPGRTAGRAPPARRAPRASRRRRRCRVRRRPRRARRSSR